MMMRNIENRQTEWGLFKRVLNDRNNGVFKDIIGDSVKKVYFLKMRSLIISNF